MGKSGITKVNRRDFEIKKKKKRSEKHQAINPALIDQRERLISDIAKLGFTREDVELILRIKGCYANDKSLIID